MAYRDAVLLLMYCGLIYYLSDQPLLPTPMLFPHQDKIIHAVVYALMVCLAWRVIIHTDRSVLFCAVGALLFCSLYGLSDEWHQSFVPNRHADIWDWLADTVGAALSISLIVLYKIKCKPRLAIHIMEKI